MKALEAEGTPASTVQPPPQSPSANEHILPRLKNSTGNLTEIDSSPKAEHLLRLHQLRTSTLLNHPSRLRNALPDKEEVGLSREDNDSRPKKELVSNEIHLRLWEDGRNLHGRKKLPNANETFSRSHIVPRLALPQNEESGDRNSSLKLNSKAGLRYVPISNFPQRNVPSFQENWRHSEIQSIFVPRKLPRALQQEKQTSVDSIEIFQNKPAFPKGRSYHSDLHSHLMKDKSTINSSFKNPTSLRHDSKTRVSEHARIYPHGQLPNNANNFRKSARFYRPKMSFVQPESRFVRSSRFHAKFSKPYTKYPSPFPEDNLFQSYSGSSRQAEEHMQTLLNNSRPYPVSDVEHQTLLGDYNSFYHSFLMDTGESPATGNNDIKKDSSGSSDMEFPGLFGAPPIQYSSLSGPSFVSDSREEYSAVAGTTAILTCTIRNLHNHTVSSHKTKYYNECP